MTHLTLLVRHTKAQQRWTDEPRPLTGSLSFYRSLAEKNPEYVSWLVILARPPSFPPHCQAEQSREVRAISLLLGANRTLSETVSYIIGDPLDPLVVLHRDGDGVSVCGRDSLSNARTPANRLRRGSIMTRATRWQRGDRPNIHIHTHIKH
jgi:hypothetical protein